MVWRGWTGAFVPLGLLAASWLSPASAEARRVVYLNTEPTALTDANGQDPTTDSFSSNGFTPGMISGWPALSEAQKELLLYYLKETTLPFDVEFTWERPAQGSYDMIVMGTDTDADALFSGLGCSAAVGLSDCDDAQAENIGFLFYGCMSMAQQEDMRRVAFNTLVGLGFGWGLENLSISGEVMGSYTANALEFGTRCAAISGTSQCSHEGCAAEQQNSTADLLARLGARVDDGPPVVTITTPADLSVVDPDLTVAATVEDVFGGLEVTLEVVEAGQMLSDTEPPYQWDLTGVPQGMWTLRVHATDADQNNVTQEVVVCVDLDECGAPPPGDTGGSSDTGTTGAAGDSTTGTTGSGEGSSSSDGGGIDPTAPPPGTGGLDPAGADTGCHCRSEGSTTGSAIWSLCLLGLLRRRRSHSRRMNVHSP